MQRSDHEYLSGERVYLGHSKSRENVSLHLERYRFASAALTAGATVLDAACGSGYGTELLAGRALRVVGLDISDHALAYAARHHARSNIEFRQADLDAPVGLAAGSFDTIVSFETLEHVKEQELLVSEFHRLLRVGGILILSTPDRTVSERLSYRNKFHTHELSQPELTELIGRYFTLRELYGQVTCAVTFWKRPLLWLSRMDVMNVRSRFADASAVPSSAKRLLRPIALSDSGANIVRITSGDINAYVYLIVVAVKAN